MTRKRLILTRLYAGILILDLPFLQDLPVFLAGMPVISHLWSYS